MTGKPCIRITFLMLWFLLIIGIFFPPLPLSAKERDCVSFTRQKKFIQELFHKKRYFDSIAETRRLMVCGSQDIDRDGLFFINQNYYLGGQYRTVIRNLAGENRDLEYRQRLLLSQSYLRIGNTDQSLTILDRIRYSDLADDKKYDLLSRKIEIYLEQGRYRFILGELSLKETGLAQSERIARMQQEIENFGNLHLKSVPLSLVLSMVIPGAGQIYSGRYLSGVLSFLSVAATAVGAWYFSRQGNDEVTLAFSFFTAVFYLGNLYGAYNSAFRANETTNRKFQTTFKERYIPEYNPIEELRGNKILQ